MRYFIVFLIFLSSCVQESICPSAPIGNFEDQYGDKWSVWKSSMTIDKEHDFIIREHYKLSFDECMIYGTRMGVTDFRGYVEDPPSRVINIIIRYESLSEGGYRFDVTGDWRGTFELK